MNEGSSEDEESETVRSVRLAVLSKPGATALPRLENPVPVGEGRRQRNAPGPARQVRLDAPAAEVPARPECIVPQAPPRSFRRDALPHPEALNGLKTFMESHKPLTDQMQVRIYG